MFLKNSLKLSHSHVFEKSFVTRSFYIVGLVLEVLEELKTTQCLQFCSLSLFVWSEVQVSARRNVKYLPLPELL